MRASDGIAATDHAHGIDGGGHHERRIGREAGKRHGGRELDRGPGGAGGSGREPEHGKAAGPKPKTPDVGRRAKLPLPRFRPNNTGDPEKPAATPGLRPVVDCDLSNYFGEIPHAELLKSFARRISDGRMLKLIKAWLEMPVEEDDGKGGKRRTNRACKERKGTPQGAPTSPLASNLYMRRFVLGWKELGHARRLRSEIVNYAADLCVLGKAPAADMLAAVERLMAGLKLPVNERKARCLRCPEETFEFLGYRIGRIYRPTGKGSYIGTRPSKASVQRISRTISDMTARKHGWQSPEAMVERLNRTIIGWANYFSLGHVSPAYSAVNQHAVRRLRQWLCRKHKVRSGGFVRFPDEGLRNDYGLVSLTRKTLGLPSAKA